MEVGREDQRDGRARRRDRATDDRDADAVQRPLCLVVPVALGLVVKVGEVHLVRVRARVRARVRVRVRVRVWVRVRARVSEVHTA